MIPENTQEFKVALVTGGARRIGAAIVKKLHENGYDVLIHYLNSLEEASTLSKSLNSIRSDSALIVQEDLSNDNFAKIITVLSKWKGRLDLLVNNASLFLKSKTDEFKPKLWEELFRVNVQAPYMLSLLSYPYLVKQGGAIINLGDIHAEKPLKNYGIYSQTKAALVMQTKVLAREFAPLVRVNAVSPGATLWPEGEAELNEEIKEEIVKKTPLGFFNDPGFTAEAVLTLAQNKYISGQVLRVDGGRSIV